MVKKGSKFTLRQLDRLSAAHLGQVAWNKDTGGCKRGHDPSLYTTPASGISVCVECRRENAAKSREKHKEKLFWTKRVQRYGISVLELDRIFNRQRGACVICRTMFCDGDFRIDHDHATGMVRGLLCASCNTGIGLFKDSPRLLANAIGYLNDDSNRVSGQATPPAQESAGFPRFVISQEGD